MFEEVPPNCKYAYARVSSKSHLYFQNLSFGGEHKNDLRLKLLLIQSLSVKDLQKKLDIQKLFERVRISNSRMVQIKEKLIQLLQELVEEKSLRPEIQVISKSGKKKYVQIKNLTSSSITRRIKYLKFNEIIHNHK